MSYRSLIQAARRHADLTVTELAARAGTSRATLSAYEHGRKAPTATTLERILEAAGFTLTIEPAITFKSVPAYRGRQITVPSRLPRHRDLQKIRLPKTVMWSEKPREYDLTDPVDRKIAYRAIMSQGGPSEILEYIDEQLLLEVFDDMALPPATRAAWQPVVDAARRMALA